MLRLQSRKAAVSPVFMIRTRSVADSATIMPRSLGGRCRRTGSTASQQAQSFGARAVRHRLLITNSRQQRAHQSVELSANNKCQPGTHLPMKVVQPSASRTSMKVRNAQIHHG